jgi:lipopolysaccharide heptosyltransferase II
VETLIIKLGATGDVVRTTPLLKRLTGRVTWITAAKNTPLLTGLSAELHCVPWEERHSLPDLKYDLAVNLEDSIETGEYLRGLKCSELYGAYLDSNDQLRYTDSARPWFDLSLISRFGRREADKLKLRNRQTYQDLVFQGLGLRFQNERYFLPEPLDTDLSGDVAIAPEAGPVWPMKNWAHYDALKRTIESTGLVVNLLPRRASLLEHLADVKSHRCLVGGDSLPMHFALGTGTRCVTLFNCTSPWEIHDYGLQTKIVSNLLDEFFYQRGFDQRATTAISLDEVLGAVQSQLKLAARKLAPVTQG